MTPVSRGSTSTVRLPLFQSSATNPDAPGVRRAASSDSFENLTPPRELTLEESLEFAREDECVEVTPEDIRIRKVILDSNERAKANRARAKV